MWRVYDGTEAATIAFDLTSGSKSVHAQAFRVSGGQVAISFGEKGWDRRYVSNLTDDDVDSDIAFYARMDNELVFYHLGGSRAVYTEGNASLAASSNLSNLVLYDNVLNPSKNWDALNHIIVAGTVDDRDVMVDTGVLTSQVSANTSDTAIQIFSIVPAPMLASGTPYIADELGDMDTSRTEWVVPIPETVEEGDLILCIMTDNWDGTADEWPTASQPSDWEYDGGEGYDHDGRDVTYLVAWKTAEEAEAGGGKTVTFTSANSRSGGFWIARIVNGGDVTVGDRHFHGFGGDWEPAAMTHDANVLNLWHGHQDGGGSLGSYNSAGDFTLADMVWSGMGTSMNVSWKQLTASGTTEAVDANPSRTDSGLAAQIVVELAAAPAAAGGGAPYNMEDLVAVQVKVGTDVETVLQGYLRLAGATMGDVEGCLNELNGTSGIGIQQAFDTWMDS